ncbi:MAG: aminopeptidase P N-terminal domain-containing protein [Bdellovibrionota bacterium]
MNFGIWVGLALSWLSALAGEVIEQPWNPEFHADRRARVFEQMPAGSVALMPSGRLQNRNGDLDYEFRQDSDFYYLTGFEEPESMIALVRGDGVGTLDRVIFFVLPKDYLAELWTGARVGVEGAKLVYGATEAYPVDQAETVVRGILERTPILFHSFGGDAGLDQLVFEVLKGRSSATNGFEFRDVRAVTHELRLIKTPVEIERLQRAIDITGEGIAEIRALANTGILAGLSENHVDGLIGFGYQKRGVVRDGFPSIVATGMNATVLHYAPGAALAAESDLLLLDIGAEWGYYSADVSRTLPVRGGAIGELPPGVEAGSATALRIDAQAAIYRAVQVAQEAAIREVRPGTSYKILSSVAEEELRDALWRLGLMTEKGATWQIRVWYTHGLGHWVGLDVHDAGSYRGADGRQRLFEPGMALTVEPGLYISLASLDHAGELARARGFEVTDEEIAAFQAAVRPLVEVLYDGIGVRLEDDVLVTEDGNRVLSSGI